MIENVLPLETILFQLVFLLVAIALEAIVFHRNLRITRRTSVDYALSINLFCTVLGWAAFFTLQELLPQPFKSQLISYIFFDHLLTPQPANLNLVLISTGIVMFFSAFLIKLKGLELLQALRQTSNQRQPSPSMVDRRSGLGTRLNRSISRPNANQATVVLVANAYSHSAILLLLVLRFLSLQTPL